FGQETNRAALVGQIAEIRRSIEERPEFMVRLMVIEGASAALTETIRAAVPVEFPLSSFDLDLAALRERIETIDAVALAELRVRPGGVLEISINERIPAVIWRTADGLVMLDGEGHRVDGLNARPDRPDLPLIAGAGAGGHVAEALRLVAASRPAQARIRGLVRVGERRWDVVLDREQRILLPEVNPVQALEQVMALDQAQELLARDVRVIDMRNIARPTLGLTPEAMAELRRIKEFETGVAYR
ncbi:MAG: cell division protein FtsQ/DivIB, partial [Paracoccaceae bacterium]